MLCGAHTTACSRAETVPITHVGGRFLDFFSFYSFHIYPRCASWLLCQSKGRHFRNWWAANIASLLHICSSFPSLPAPFLFSVISSLACSFPLINSLIKDTTSKSQPRGLCLPASVRDGNKKRKQAFFPSSSFALCLHLILNSCLRSSICIISSSRPSVLVWVEPKTYLMPKVNCGATLHES